MQRAEKTLEWCGEHYDLLGLALDNFSLGRGHLLKVLTAGGKDYSEAEEHLNEAMERLHKASIQQFIMRGLLARAELYRTKNAFPKAHHDLDEAMTIATRSDKGLHKADCHLEYSRLYLAEGNKDKAKEYLSTAQKR